MDFLKDINPLLSLFNALLVTLYFLNRVANKISEQKRIKREQQNQKRYIELWDEIKSLPPEFGEYLDAAHREIFRQLRYKITKSNSDENQVKNQDQL